MRSLMVALLGLVFVFGLGVGSASADTLHGYCDNGCIDNGTNSPSNGQPSNFGFTVSPGPKTGNLTIDILIPNNLGSGLGPFSITGTLSGSATLFNTTAWTSGFLDAYLGISASPS